MKAIWLFKICFLLLMPITNAQNTGELFYKNGMSLVGLQPKIGFGEGKIIGAYNLRYSHFFIDKVCTGIDFTYGNYGKYLIEYPLGSFVRYYFFYQERTFLLKPILIMG